MRAAISLQFDYLSGCNRIGGRGYLSQLCAVLADIDEAGAPSRLRWGSQMGRSGERLTDGEPARRIVSVRRRSRPGNS